ncbi:MAG: lytic transglycosylase domain-containing protein [Oscillospiraceae bacterium]|nr:lytic transglycosylase domain-containing protein [Oscillospiraceae bacterium]
MTKYRRKRRALPVVIVCVILAAALAVVGYFVYCRVERYTHPIKYEELVEKYSRQNGLDKYLVYAVIKTESGFDPGAVSNVGARGLMQIMEDTFDWVKFKLGDEDTRYLEMYDPDTNIRYGCWLLGYLYKEFGNVEAAMAAYHAGRGQVNEWLSDERYSSDGVHLDEIPISDTAHYVQKIVRARDTYIKLYSKG